MSTRLPPVRSSTSFSQKSGASRGGAQQEDEPQGGYEAYVPPHSTLLAQFPQHTPVSFPSTKKKCSRIDAGCEWACFGAYQFDPALPNSRVFSLLPPWWWGACGARGAGGQKGRGTWVGGNFELASGRGRRQELLGVMKQTRRR